jgi:hypothetical protein
MPTKATHKDDNDAGSIEVCGSGSQELLGYLVLASAASQLAHVHEPCKPSTESAQVNGPVLILIRHIIAPGKK